MPSNDDKQTQSSEFQRMPFTLQDIFSKFDEEHFFLAATRSFRFSEVKKEEREAMMNAAQAIDAEDAKVQQRLLDLINLKKRFEANFEAVARKAIEKGDIEGWKEFAETVSESTRILNDVQTVLNQQQQVYINHLTASTTTFSARISSFFGGIFSYLFGWENKQAALKSKKSRYEKAFVDENKIVDGAYIKARKLHTQITKIGAALNTIKSIIDAKDPAQAFLKAEADKGQQVLHAQFKSFVPILLKHDSGYKTKLFNFISKANDELTKCKKNNDSKHFYQLKAFLALPYISDVACYYDFAGNPFSLDRVKLNFKMLAQASDKEIFLLVEKIKSARDLIDNDVEFGWLSDESLLSKIKKTISEVIEEEHWFTSPLLKNQLAFCEQMISVLSEEQRQLIRKFLQNAINEIIRAGKHPAKLAKGIKRLEEGMPKGNVLFDEAFKNELSSQQNKINDWAYKIVAWENTNKIADSKTMLESCSPIKDYAFGKVFMNELEKNMMITEPKDLSPIQVPIEQEIKQVAPAKPGQSWSLTSVSAALYRYVAGSTSTAEMSAVQLPPDATKNEPVAGVKDKQDADDQVPSIDEATEIAVQLAEKEFNSYNQAIRRFDDTIGNSKLNKQDEELRAEMVKGRDISKSNLDRLKQCIYKDKEINVAEEEGFVLMDAEQPSCQKSNLQTQSIFLAKLDDEDKKPDFAENNGFSFVR